MIEGYFNTLAHHKYDTKNVFDLENDNWLIL